MLNVLATTLIAIPVGPQSWQPCLYNNKSIECRMTYLCKKAPCYHFKLEWKDGASDIYSGKPGIARNYATYKDTRGGQWAKRSLAGTFNLKNTSNGNTIIYGLTLDNCTNPIYKLGDFCD